MKRFLPRVLFVAALLAATLASPASAHEQRVSGVVLTVIPEKHEVVVRCDRAASQPSRTVLFRLSPRVAAGTLRPGRRIVGLVDDDAGPLLDEVRILPDAPIPSAVRVVHPLNIGDQLPATRFVDQTGRSFDFADFHGKSVVLSFIYTRCRDPKECPAISSSYAVLQRRLAQRPYHLVEMTLDPAYDRPAILRRYGATFRADPARWTLATGDLDGVLAFDARFGIDPFADPRVGLIHTERTVLIAPDGKILDFIDQAGWNPNDIAARLESAGAAPANPIARLDFELSKAAVAVCGNRVAGFSGLADLAIVLAIFAAAFWLLRRVARKIFAEQI